MQHKVRMEKITLGTKVAQLREERGLTMLEVGQLCDISESTYWKVERDRSVRWETVHLVAVAGFKFSPHHPDYQELHALWLEKRQTMAESQTPEFASRTLSKHAVEAGRKFRNLIRNLSKKQTLLVLSGAELVARDLVKPRAKAAKRTPRRQ
jgi:transcriptional regulator with XRE-family HTH domain